MPRCAYSRDPKNCRGSADGCNREHRALTDAEKLKRDKYEQAKLDAGNLWGTSVLLNKPMPRLLMSR
eukprot:2370755-Pyramimonas_sp.AAC.1